MRKLLIVLLAIPLCFACSKDDADTDIPVWYICIKYNEASTALRPASVNVDVIDPDRNSITSFEELDANTWLYKIPQDVNNILIKVAANIDNNNVDNAVALHRIRTNAYNTHTVIFGYSATGVFIPSIAVVDYNESTGIITPQAKASE